MIDISGQELMTTDKVTLRLNAVVTYKMTDVVRAVTAVDDFGSALYREAQLALRAVVGARELTFGIKDVILPGDMKELMNRVIEARKAAQANLIARQEETAAMRSQANTARLLENNPTLMRLRELEVLEKIAAGNKLSVVLGDKGLADRMMHLL